MRGSRGRRGDLLCVCSVPVELFLMELYGILIKFKLNEIKNPDLICRHKKQKISWRLYPGGAKRPKKQVACGERQGKRGKAIPIDRNPLKSNQHSRYGVGKIGHETAPLN